MIDCLRCSTSFDPTVDYDGQLKERKTRPRRFCTKLCMTYYFSRKQHSDPSTWPSGVCICGETFDASLPYDLDGKRVSQPRKYCSRRCKERAHRERNPAPFPMYGRERHVHRVYGLSPEDYRQMLSIQENVCAICRQPETKIIRGTLAQLAIDHDHVTGRVRGLLCDKCNRGLAVFRDDPDYLVAAAIYLEKGND